MAYLAECNLATLEEWQDQKSQPKYRAGRACDIANESVGLFRAFGTMDDANAMKAGRLIAILEGKVTL